MCVRLIYPYCTPFNISLQSLEFPMLSSSIFSANGSVYQQSAVFGTTFQLNQTALEEIGLPALTGSNAWHNLTANLAVSGSHTKPFRASYLSHRSVA